MEPNRSIIRPSSSLTTQLLDIQTFISLYINTAATEVNNLCLEDFILLEIDNTTKTVGVTRFSFTTILLCISGQLDMIVGQHHYSLKAQDISIIPAESINSLSSFSDDFKAYMVVFKSDFLKKGFVNSSILEELLFINPEYPPVFELDAALFESNRYKFEKIKAEYYKASPFYLDMIRLYLIQILYDYNRVCEICLLNSTTSMNRQFQIVHKFRKLVDKHFALFRTVKEYSDLLHISPKYLSECVKQQTGFSAIDIIHQKITLEAEFLLRYSELSIKEIATALSFDTLSHFSRFFKAQKKCTPSEYRLLP
ncbi:MULTISPECIES: helix-turn-helix domain-containing protein [Flavobacterium]|uniref:helix-turn-helix domain-containing protein n=1 Tax=Flavobacterium TaxID=237 RepID=UPI000B29E629|nr:MULTISPECIES: helix-turn-helix domain-containing protein [Flavobacterium]MBN9284170.1 AraC family transcriptional regulator [Flavobacterium sp.]